MILFIRRQIVVEMSWSYALQFNMFVFLTPRNTSKQFLAEQIVFFIISAISEVPPSDKGTTSAVKKWAYKRGDLFWWEQFSSILLSQCFGFWSDNRGGLWWKWLYCILFFHIETLSMKILIYMQGKKNSCVSSSILEKIRVGRQAKI